MALLILKGPKLTQKLTPAKMENMENMDHKSSKKITVRVIDILEIKNYFYFWSFWPQKKVWMSIWMFQKNC